MVKLMKKNDLVIKRVPIDVIHQDPANARKHGQRNIESIRGSIRQFGQVEPLVVQKSTGKVIGGNGRLEVLRQENVTMVDVVEVDIDDTQSIALGIALNRTAELAEWDMESLDTIVNSLSDTDIDLGGIGFGVDDLDELLDRNLTSEDEDEIEVKQDTVPDPPKNPVAELGDVWTLGPHTVVCGDSLKQQWPAHQIVFTDPPYGVNYEGVTNDAPEDRESKILPILDLVFEASEPGAIWYMASPSYVLGFVDWMIEKEILRQLLVWVKNNFVFGRSDYHWRHELLLYGWKKGATHHAVKDRKQSTVWEFDKGSSAIEHPTSKPVELVAKVRPRVLRYGVGATICGCHNKKVGEFNRQKSN
jgi:hypothetical protein